MAGTVCDYERDLLDRQSCQCGGESLMYRRGFSGSNEGL